MAQQGSDEQQAKALAPLVAAQAAARANLTAQAVAFATASARSFTGWYDPARITAWAEQLAKHLEALQRAQARTTDAYMARVLSQMLGTRIRPAGAVPVADLRTGVTHAGAYGRAANVYRWRQSQLDAFARRIVTASPDELTALRPPDLVRPVEAAIDRVAAVADMDMQLADRAQAATVLQDNAERHDIRGYRRVIHPELSKGGTCGLCIAASDRVYHLDTLRPLHARCECTTLPIVGVQDPGSGLNNLDLGTLYEHAGSTSGKALKQTRYRVDEHGELGPVLTDGTFRSQRAAKRAQNDVKPKTEAERLAAVRSIRERLDAAVPRARDLAKSDPSAWSGYLHELEARIEDIDRQLAA